MNYKSSLIMFFAAIQTLAAQDYSSHFYNKALRFDYYRCGDARTEQIFVDSYAEEPFWGGSKKNLIDTTARGEHFVKVFDVKSGELIFSRGHNSLFQEWKSTPEAASTPRAFAEAFQMPYPKNDVRIEFYSRTPKGEYEKIFAKEVDVESYFIKKERSCYDSFEVFNNGHYDSHVDIVILPEGYTKDQRAQFENDCKEFTEAIFSFQPYKDSRSLFNVRGVWAPSEESGPDNPGEGCWRNTQFNVMFYTFDSERYQMTTDYRHLKQVAATVPYDYIYVLSNTTKYGGGGIYNFYAIGASANPGLAAKVHVHEFGHLFAGLGDEYTDGAATEELYSLAVEPWEPNLTTMVNFDSKWKDMTDPKIPVPTPVEERYLKKVGVYEGAGYMNKGIYRPAQKCLMREFTNVEDFCPVCTRAIKEQINWIIEH